jgi:hypothetical protein
LVMNINTENSDLMRYGPPARRVIESTQLT